MKTPPQRRTLSVGSYSPLAIPNLGTAHFSQLGVTLNGSAGSAWADQGPNALHVVQGTAANQPPYVNDGSGQGGKPYFNLGGTHWLQSAANTGLFANLPGITIFTVMAETGAISTKAFWVANGGNNTGVFQFGTNGGSNYFLNPVLMGLTNPGANVSAMANVGSVYEVYDGAKATIYRNAAQLGQSSASGNLANTAAFPFTIGAAQGGFRPLTGALYCVLTVLRALSAGELASLTNWARAFYSLAYP